MDSIAILGNTPELSALELDVPYHGGQAVLVPHTTLDIQKLGGVVKIAEPWLTLPWSGGQLPNALEPAILADLQQKTGNGKLQFGISLYAGDGTISQAVLTRCAKQLQRAGITWKQTIKQAGYMVRFVTSNEPGLSSVIVTREHLLARQTDYVVVLEKNCLRLGRTKAVQDYRGFSQRDYGRPQRDAFSGMLPPKVARMMLTIATHHDPTLTILDPFCGSGTIVQEALTLGYKHVIGSDISQKCIDATKANLAWAHLPEAQLFCSNVLALTRLLTPRSVDAIVSEGYLGPVQPKQIQSVMRELTDFYQSVLPVLTRLLKPGGKIVLALPSWNISGKIFELPLDQAIANASLHSFHQPIFYSRHTAKVVRKLFFWYT